MTDLLSKTNPKKNKNRVLKKLPNLLYVFIYRYINMYVTMCKYGEACRNDVPKRGFIDE